MLGLGQVSNGQFCWVDLAATDAGPAKEFYGHLFGWTAREQRANGGVFTRLQQSGRDVGSLYQLSRAQIDRGMPSHWTPYVRVDHVDDAVRRAVSLGGEAAIRPFDVAEMARIALIVDPVGATVGLWETTRASAEGRDYG
jgi:predicted enzyme related to lactoylglutathione lyase